MINLPKWTQRVLDESICPTCKFKADKKGVFAVGIREEIHPKTNKSYLSFFFLYKCEKCHNSGTFSGLPTSLYDYVGDMIEISNSPMPTNADIQDGTPIYMLEDDEVGISDKEVQDVKKMLKSTKYHEDFLAKIGIVKNHTNKKDNK